MAIGYVAPLGASYERMKAALFRPFSLPKWIYFGFAAWIAGWGAGDSLSSWAGRGIVRDDPAFGWAELQEGWLALWAEAWWRTLVYGTVLLIVILAIVILWVRSRGTFVLLESVAKDRLAIVEPWSRFRREGNSLFLWQLALTGIGLAVLTAVGVAIWRLVLGDGIPDSAADVGWLALVVIVLFFWLPVAFLATLVLHFLHHFVAPIMYRDRLRTNEAWRRFLRLFKENPGSFVLYALWVLLLRIATGIGVVFAVCLTCCVLGCFLAIPFVGTVLYLPVSYTLRALGPAFLEQFPGEPAILSPLFVTPRFAAPPGNPLTTP
jgi:hypothetical protein